MRMIPEQKLILAVLMRAILDAIEKKPIKTKPATSKDEQRIIRRKYNGKRRNSIKEDARVFLTSNSYAMRESRETICELAGIPTSWVDDLVKSLIKNNWYMPKQMTDDIKNIMG